MNVQIGEGFAGDQPDAAHVNTVLGHRDGPVGAAWATALATPSAGHVPFVCVLRPNVPVRPLTLFVTKATIDGGDHGELVWGAAQAGVAGGVVDAVRDGVVSEQLASECVLLAAVWVSPGARSADAVYANNRIATRAALESGAADRPLVDEVLAAGEPWNPFFEPM